MWQHRRLIIPALVVALAVPFMLLTVISGVVASVPVVPDNLLAAYKEAAKKSPVSGLRYEDLVAVDAVRFRQDFSLVTPQSIQETADFFAHCVTKEDPETGHDKAVCEARTLDDVIKDLKLTPQERQTVQQMVATLVGLDSGSSGGDEATFVFHPQGPYTWPIDAYTITSPFGARTDPVTGEGGYHTGVDIAAPMYTPVKAAATGTVKWAGWDGNYGLKVFLDNGGFKTQYAHLSVIKVEQGEVVTAGQVIGLSGSTGKSTGPHLHFEWWTDGIPVNPLEHFGEQTL